MYRFVFCACIGTDEYRGQEVETLGEAINGLMQIANYTLFLHDKDLMQDFSNYGRVEIFEDGSWVEIDEDELT